MLIAGFLPQNEHLATYRHFDYRAEQPALHRTKAPGNLVSGSFSICPTLRRSAGAPRAS